MGFTKGKPDPYLYYIIVGVDLLVLVMYVSNLFPTNAKLIVG